MNRRMRNTVCLVAASAFAGISGAAFAADTSAAHHWQSIETYCNECHNSTDWAAGLAFDVLQPEEIPADAELWEGVVRKLRGRLMPPPDTPQPDAGTLNALVGFLEGALDEAARARTDPGHVKLHRLNRTEYENEVHRLLDLKVDATELLPRDTESEGFSNISDALSVSPTFFEQYLAAARQVSIQAVGEAAPKLAHEVYTTPLHVDHSRHVRGTPLGTRGGLAIEHHFPADGLYEFNVRVSSQSGHLLRSYFAEYPHRLVMTLDGRPVFEASMGGEDDLKAIDQLQTEAAEAIVERFRKIRLQVPAGPHRITAAWMAKTFAESSAELQPLVPGSIEERIPHIKGLEVMGPLQVDGRGDTPSRRRIFSCMPSGAGEEQACARSILSRVTREAFRRPVSEAEVDVIMRFYEDGRSAADFQGGIQKGLMAVLSSPKFLYRVRPLPQGPSAPDVIELDGYSLASRLAFFLWSQGPDEELLRLAGTGELSRPDTLHRQVQRMLADPRSISLVDNFAMQWLRMGGLNAIDPDPKLYPDFDEPLRDSFHEEMRLFVDSVLRGGRSTVDLLTADYTFVNERLARHYGIPRVQGDHFRRVQLADSARWGLLGKGGVLMASSYPDRTSPVLRGTWVLESLIGAPPSAPPPGVETDLASPEGEPASTVRARLEVHRAVPACNQCHGVIDPLGLALENFDAIGGWQTLDRYARMPIDASGQLAGGGGEVRGPDDLRRALASDPRQFVQTFTEKLMTYALGRGVEWIDMPSVRAIVQDSAQSGYRFDAIVQGIVSSDAFLKSSSGVDDHEATAQVAGR